MRLSFRVVRQLHSWIGAWGAIAAILFGFSGFLQNHRGVMKLPQGESTEVSKIDIPVPESARDTPEAMRAWLVDVQHLKIDSQRTSSGRQPMRWAFSGGNARHTLQADYLPGSESITVHNSVQSPLAVISRLHKGIGGGIAWILLGDSFALAMIALGISGLMLWWRGRTWRQALVSIVGAAVLVVLVIGSLAVA